MEHDWKPIVLNDWNYVDWTFRLCSNCRTVECTPTTPAAIALWKGPLYRRIDNTDRDITDHMLSCGEMIMKDVLE